MKIRNMNKNYITQRKFRFNKAHIRKKEQAEEEKK